MKSICLHNHNCTFYRFRGGNDSNMVVMEVTLPSGYTVDNDALPSLKLSNNVKRIETKDGDSVVMLYFDKVTYKSLFFNYILLVYLND